MQHRNEFAELLHGRFPNDTVASKSGLRDRATATRNAMPAPSIAAVESARNQTLNTVREETQSPNRGTAVVQSETTSLRNADPTQSLAIQPEVTKSSLTKVLTETTATSKTFSSITPSILKPTTENHLPISPTNQSSSSTPTANAPAKNAIAASSEPSTQIEPLAKSNTPQLSSSFTLSAPTLLVAQEDDTSRAVSPSKTIEASLQTTSKGEIVNPAATRSADPAIDRTATLLMESGPSPSPSPASESSRTFAVVADGLPSNTAVGSSSATTTGIGQADPDIQSTTSMPPMGVIVGASVGGFAAIVLLSVLLWLYRRRLIRRNQSQPPTPTGFGPSDERFRHEKQTSVDSSIRVPSLDMPKRPLTNSSARSRSAGPPVSEVALAARSKHTRSASTSDNPFSDAHAVSKKQSPQPAAKPLRGIMKPPPPIPAIPPRSLARTAAQPPLTIPENGSTASKTSSIVSTGFNLQRDKFRSDPFDLEIATSKLLSRPLPSHRTSSIYIGDGAAPECKSDDEDLVRAKARPAWDSPTLPGSQPDWSKHVGRAM